MHGMIMVELRNFVTTNFNKETWDTLLRKAKLWPRLYLPISEYPDQEVVSLVSSASEMTGSPAQNILESFGEYIAAGLLKMYRPLVRDEWRTLDLLEHTETAIHTAIRLKDDKAHPPQLSCKRLSYDQVAVTYNSERRLCSVAKGIAKGVAKHYSESISISESTCMHRGDETCRILVRQNDALPQAEPVKQAARGVDASMGAPNMPDVRKPLETKPEAPRRKRKRRSFFDWLIGRKPND